VQEKYLATTPCNIL